MRNRGSVLILLSVRQSSCILNAWENRIFLLIGKFFLLLTPLYIIVTVKEFDVLIRNFLDWNVEFLSFGLIVKIITILLESFTKARFLRRKLLAITNDSEVGLAHLLISLLHQLLLFNWYWVSCDACLDKSLSHVRMRVAKCMVGSRKIRRLLLLLFVICNWVWV